MNSTQFLADCRREYAWEAMYYTYKVILRLLCESLLPRKSNITYYIFVCVCVCVRTHGCVVASARLGTYFKCAWVFVCVGMCMRACILSYPERKFAQYWHIWTLWIHHIFRLNLKNVTVFGKEVLSIKCEIWFSLHIFSKIFLILRRIKRDTVINVITSSWKVPVVLVGFS
jgi:hypothetical protein